jgi:hypothetical protein
MEELTKNILEAGQTGSEIPATLRDFLLEDAPDVERVDDRPEIAPEREEEQLETIDRPLAVAHAAPLEADGQTPRHPAGCAKGERPPAQP